MEVLQLQRLLKCIIMNSMLEKMKDKIPGPAGHHHKLTIKSLVAIL